MWEGEWTKELQELFNAYAAENDGFPADEHDEICYDAMTYDEFVGYIKEALRRHCGLPDVVDQI